MNNRLETTHARKYISKLKIYKSPCYRATLIEDIDGALCNYVSLKYYMTPLDNLNSHTERKSYFPT